MATALALLLTGVPGDRAWAQETVGVNAAIRNSVQTRRGTSSALSAAVLRANVAIGDQFVTGANSQVQVLLRDRSTFTVGANARMTVDRFVVSDRGAGGVTASVARGAFRFASGRTSRSGSRQAISTPVASIGIRGTIVEGIVGPEALALLRSAPGVPAFTGDAETVVLIVLRGPSGDSASRDTPGAVDIEREGVVTSLDRPGQALIVTSDGVFGPFFLTDDLSALLAALLSPLPGTGEEDELVESAGAAADGPSLLFEQIDSDPLDGFDPLPGPDEDRTQGEFPFFPPVRPN
jgi:hypothetical protein